MESQTPRERLGRYELIRQLGEGGSATVYLARDTALDREVALKCLKPGGPLFADRFLREAQVLAKLAHPNIIAVYDAGQERSSLFLVMELVRGKPLGSLIAVRRRDRRALLVMLMKVARAVEYAHVHGVVHRDLKPANILVGEGDEPKVVDFGLVHLMQADHALTRSGMTLGTPLYMAPEQIEPHGREITPRTDVYALGAILYEILTGRVPHVAASEVALYAAILGGDPVPPRRLDPSVSTDLETIALKALDRDPERRYATAEGFARDIAHVLDGEAIEARPPSLFYRVRRFAGRRRSLLAAALAAALVSGAATAVVVPRWRAEQARRIEVERASLRAEERRRIELAASEEQGRRRAEALQTISHLWSTIVDRKRDLRMLKLAPDEARRELAAAVDAVGAFVEAWPEDPRGYYVRARGRWYLGAFDAAAEDVKRALARHEDFRPGWALLGMIRFEQYQASSYSTGGAPRAQTQEAANALLVEAQHAFERGWERGREPEEAQRWGLPWTREDEVAQVLSAASVDWYLRGERKPARASVEAAFDRYRAEEYARWLGVAVGGRDRVKWLEQAVALAPGYVEAIMDVACARTEAGDVKGAIAAYTRVLELRGDFSYAYVNRGCLKNISGDPDGAIEDHGRALAVQPDLADAHYNRGVARKAKGDVRGAMADYDRVIELVPDYAAAYLNRSDLRRVVGDLDGSIADCDRLIALNRKLGEAYCNRGVAKSAKHDRKGAIADFRTALRVAEPAWRFRRMTEELLKAALAAGEE